MTEDSGLRERLSTRPLVTIGLPVFDGERFIDEAIRSIRDQTLEDFELIIADNGSTDRTLEICRRHAEADRRITVVTSDHNQGAAWNFNRIVPLASGEFFKWSAHDDIVEPDFLSKCLAVLTRHPDVVLCSTKAIDVDEHGNELHTIASKPYATQPSAVDRARELLAFDSSCVEVFGVIRLETLRRTELIGAYTSSDRALLLELCTHGRFHEIDEPLLRRRQHEERSVRLSARQRNAWFDPDRQDVFTFPKWRLLHEFIRAVGRSPLTRTEQAVVISAVARWSLRNARALARDGAAWGKFLLDRTVARSAETPEQQRAGV